MIQPAIRTARRVAVAALAVGLTTVAIGAVARADEGEPSLVGTAICVTFSGDMEPDEWIAEPSDCASPTPGPTPSTAPTPAPTPMPTPSDAPSLPAPGPSTTGPGTTPTGGLMLAAVARPDARQPLADPPARVGTYSKMVSINTAPNTQPLRDNRGRYNNWIYVSGLTLNGANSSDFTPGYYQQGVPVNVNLYQSPLLFPRLRKPTFVGTARLVFTYDELTDTVYVARFPF